MDNNMTNNQIKLIYILSADEKLLDKFCKINNLDNMYTFAEGIVKELTRYEFINLLLNCIRFCENCKSMSSLELANISAGVSSKFISGVLASVIMLPTSIQAMDSSNTVEHPNTINNTSNFNIKPSKNSYENNISKTIVKIGTAVLSTVSVLGIGKLYKNSDNFFQRNVIDGNDDEFRTRDYLAHEIKTNKWNVSKINIDNRLFGHQYSPDNQKGELSGKYVIFYSGGDLPNEMQIQGILDKYINMGATVIGVNYTGFGDSGKNISAGHIRENILYKDAHDIYNYVCKYFNIKSENIILHGFSLGGAMAAHVAANVYESKQKLYGLILHSSIKNSTSAALGFLSDWNLAAKVIGTTGTYLFADQFDTVKELKRLRKYTAEIPIAVCSGDQNAGDHLSLTDTELDKISEKIGFKNIKIHFGTKEHLIQASDNENISTAPPENFDLPNFIQN